MKLRKIKETTKDVLRYVKWRIRRPLYPLGADIRLHLGCGDIDYPDFVNIDARPGKHVHHVQRIDELHSFSESSVTLVYASHCLEHIPHRRVAHVLEEWRRVLKPGGIIRISVPDFDLLVDVYAENGRNVEFIQMPLMGGQDYPFNFHYTCFNRAEIVRLFLNAGFKSPRPWTHGTDKFTSVPDWSGEKINIKGKDYPVSLNFEAFK